MPVSDFPISVLIAGPTASGKSAAAIDIARKLNGEIINADAIQVYRDLEILSARPSTDEVRDMPHHLYGHVDGRARYSVGAWVAAVRAVLAHLAARNRAAIFVGGTGLYFRALTDGLSVIPDIPAQIRRAACARLAEIGIEKLRQEVLDVDPVMARLAPADRQRHLRAWEVHAATGQTLSSFQALETEPVLSAIAARVVLAPARDQLYARCEARFDAMLVAGGRDEAEALNARQLAPDLPVMKALGAAELIAALNGTISDEDAARLAKRNTRRFAKRQLTWFRNQTADWPRAENGAAAIDEVFRQLRKC